MVYPSLKSMSNIFNFRKMGENFRSRYQHKVIGYVQAPDSALCLAMNYEIPVPWKHILEHWEYALLKDYLCIGTRFRVTCDSFASLVRRGQPLMWTVCCHDRHEDSLEARARRAFMMQLVKELLSGADYNILFPFYRSFVNKNLSFRFLYEGSLMFRGLHLIFLRFNYWGDVSRVRALKYSKAVFCVGFSGVYMVVICSHCADLSNRSAMACAERTRSKLLHAAIVCNTLILPPSEYELEKQRQLKRLTDQPQPSCICL